MKNHIMKYDSGLLEPPELPVEGIPDRAAPLEPQGHVGGQEAFLHDVHAAAVDAARGEKAAFRNTF